MNLNIETWPVRIHIVNLYLFQTEVLFFDVFFFVNNQYHGGTNFGRSAAEFMITGYYDQAPLDEYGKLS